MAKVNRRIPHCWAAAAMALWLAMSVNLLPAIAHGEAELTVPR